MTPVPVLFALLLATTTAFSAADVLLVEHPEALYILDRYQQRVQHPSRQGIVPFVPLRIVEARGTLSDAFTPSMRIESAGETFFLLTDEAGRILRAGEAGTLRWHRGVVLLGDTLEVLRAGALRMSDPLRRSSMLLEAGARIRSEFRSGAETYVRLIDGVSRFGWVRLEPRDQGRLWRTPLPKAGPAHVPLRSAEARVSEILEQTNRLLDSLFTFMNLRLRTSREAPRWELRREEGELTCVLRGLSDPAAMTESTAVLAKRIELAVSGSGVAVSHTAGTIRIRP